MPGRIGKFHDPLLKQVQPGDGDLSNTLHEFVAEPRVFLAVLAKTSPVKENGFDELD